MPPGVTGGAADLPVRGGRKLQQRTGLQMAGEADCRIGLAANDDGHRGMGGVTPPAVLRLCPPGMRLVAFLAGKGLAMAFMAGATGKPGMETRCRGEGLPDSGMAVETGVEGFPGRYNLQRPMRIAVAGQTRGVPVEMGTPLVAGAAGGDDFQIPGGVASMAVETVDGIPVGNAGFEQDGGNLRVALGAVGNGHAPHRQFRPRDASPAGQQQSPEDEDRDHLQDSVHRLPCCDL